MRLSMPAQPIFGTTPVVLTACGKDFCGQGNLQALGRWHVEVLVRSRKRPATVRDVPFDLMNGANARFLFSLPPDTRFGPATVTLGRVPDGSALLRVLLRPNLVVRAMASMPNMASMGTASYPVESQANGWYSVSLAFPMTGVEQLLLQVRGSQGWQTARILLYDVDSAGNASLLTNTAT
jgi:hypothetical protein